ncbi:hypothetical protein [Tepidiforma thermophila]|uniref:Mycothiol-dependent maleylpyruvate isomerase metal-binding domain-containing protein n=1 Tax=Tepidiforma thermophila (strain KCTC 52669 / CGMCC 1.13589 / G233) TaxID=2761530 RepID=A0A2A9HF97_TEPT2|nr:hypothetical protein [Tepidiforma thermophila]PFG74458.1 hypothetical protein A9A59_1688 [Tepidiforma thermophila]
MHVIVRSAVDRLMYEQAVTIRLLSLAPPDAWQRPVPARGTTVAGLVGQLAADEEALAGWLGDGMPAELPCAPAESGGSATLDSALERLRAALRAAAAAAGQLPETLPAGPLAELWKRAALFTRERDALLEALPEAADDAIVARWKKAPEPPSEPRLANAQSDAVAPGG